MAAPVPTFLIPIYSSFRVIVMNLKGVIDLENSFQQLITMRFNSKMAADFDLKNILLRLPINEKDEKLNNWRRMIIDKIDKLEPLDEETMSKYAQIEEEALKDDDSELSGDSASDDSDSSDDEESEEPLAKRICSPVESKTVGTASNPREKLVIRIANPFAKKPVQPMIPVTEKTSQSSGRALLSSTRLSFEEYMVKNGVKLDFEKIKEESAAQKAGMKRPAVVPGKASKKPVSRAAESSKIHGDDFLCRKRTAPLKIVPRKKAPVKPPPPIVTAAIARPQLTASSTDYL